MSYTVSFTALHFAGFLHGQAAEAEADKERSYQAIRAKQLAGDLSFNEAMNKMGLPTEKAKKMPVIADAIRPPVPDEPGFLHAVMEELGGRLNEVGPQQVHPRFAYCGFALTQRSCTHVMFGVQVVKKNSKKPGGKKKRTKGKASFGRPHKKVGKKAKGKHPSPSEPQPKKASKEPQPEKASKDKAKKKRKAESEPEQPVQAG